MKKCINCKKSYKTKMLGNYNLDLCDSCFNKLEDQIDIDEHIQKVTVTCPKCKRVYDWGVVDQKCKTKGCNVHFFKGDPTNMIVARWVDI